MSTKRVPLLLVFLLVQTALAAPYDLDWVREQWALADAFELPEQIVMKWTRTEYPEETADDLAEYQSIIEGKPDHPLRRKAETLARRLATGGDVAEWTLWYEDEDRFRLSNTYPDGSLAVEFNDTVVDGDRAWRMTDRGLHLLDMNELPEDEHPRMGLSQFRTNLMYSIWTGFGTGGQDRHPESVEIGDGRWSCKLLGAKPGNEWVLDGLIDADGLVIQSSTVRLFASVPKYEGGRTEYSDRRWNQVLGQMISHSHTFYDRDDRRMNTVEIVELRPLEAGELDALLIEPTVDSIDTVRGKVGFRAIYNMRGTPSVVETGLGSMPKPPVTPLAKPKRGIPLAYPVIGLGVLLFLLIAFKVWEGSQK